MSNKSPLPLIAVKRSRKLYQGKHFSFNLDDLTLPDDQRVTHATVRHPGSAAIVPIDAENNVVMIRQYRHSVKAMMLEVPAGTMDPDENSLACARRELAEETGIVAQEFIDLGPTHILPSYSDELIHIFLARYLSETEQSLDSDEFIEVVRYPIETVLQKIDEGDITEALTIVSLFKAKRYLDR